jgi:hypothetical protein
MTLALTLITLTLALISDRQQGLALRLDLLWLYLLGLYLLWL